MSPISDFVKAFDPLKDSHVIWLKKMNDLAEKLSDPSQSYSLMSEINSNPFGLSLAKQDALAWVEIHFGIAMKYTQAVLKSQALVPGVSITPA